MAVKAPSWQVDRHIPLALILTIAIQTVGVVWWAATLTGRVNDLEAKVHAQGQAIAPIIERSIRVETRLESVHERLGEMTGILRNSILSYVPPALKEPDNRPMKPALTR